MLGLAKTVEKKFKSNNNENGLSEEYYNLFKRNKIETNIKNYIIERYVKNALIAGQPLEHINNNYEILAIEKNIPYLAFDEIEIENIPELPETLISNIPEHVSSIIIRNFRRFKELKVENIGLFNLVVGDNNVGKTSFLEAFLFSSDKKDYLERLAFAFIQRANILPEKVVTSDQNIIFFRLNNNFINDFPNNSEKDLKIGFELTYKRTAWSYDVNFSQFDYEVVKNLAYEKNLQQPFMPYGKGYSIDLAQAYHDNIGGNYSKVKFF